MSQRFPPGAVFSGAADNANSSRNASATAVLMASSWVGMAAAANA
ncbi:MAG: hypothetical protein OXU83_02720 [Gammaproteobacteria bacterium]|nr:hypothetical protein [Gammaproteobacteria bacterium]